MTTQESEGIVVHTVHNSLDLLDGVIQTWKNEGSPLSQVPRRLSKKGLLSPRKVPQAKRVGMALIVLKGWTVEGFMDKLDGVPPDPLDHPLETLLIKQGFT